MTELALDVAAADGTAEGFLYTPDGPGPWPGVVFLTDVFGIRPANRALAARLADRGYGVLLPNIFYRTDALPILDFELQMGEERSMHRLQELLGALDAGQMARDGAAYAELIRARDEVGGERVAIVGYCFTGQMALRTAAEAPGAIACAASFHGGRLVTDAPDSPHTVLPRVGCELYFGHATEDASMTPAHIETLEAALAAWGGRYTSEVYPARHGWTLPGREVYDEPQAERAFEALLALLARALA